MSMSLTNECCERRRLLEFLPLNRRSEEVLAASFASRDLSELLRLHRAQASQVSALSLWKIIPVTWTTAIK